MYVSQKIQFRAVQDFFDVVGGKFIANYCQPGKFQRALLLFATLITCTLLSNEIIRADDIYPLPGGCISGTPDNSQGEEVCCINGRVIIDGKAVDHVPIEITGPDGETVQLRTQLFESNGFFDPEEPRYAYQFSDLPLSIQPGDIVTITARIGEHHLTVVHEAIAGPQVVDIVLPQRKESDRYVDTFLQSTAVGESLSGPTAIAFDSIGNLYLSDINRVVKYRKLSNAADGKEWQYVLAWGNQGKGLGEFSEIGAIAVDNSDRIWVTDISNGRIQAFSSSGDFLGAWTLGLWVGDLEIDADNYVYVFHEAANKAEIKRYKIVEPGPENGGDLGLSLVQQWGAGGAQSTDEVPFRTPFWKNRLAVHSETSGEVWVYASDLGNGRIIKFNNAGIRINTWPVILPGGGEIPENLAPYEFRPYDLETDSAGTLYMSGSFLGPDTADKKWHDAFFRYDSDGMLLGLLPCGEYCYPVAGLAFDNENNLFGAYPITYRVVQYDNQSLAADPVSVLEGENPVDENFDNPVSVARDSAGAYYISEPEWNAGRSGLFGHGAIIKYTPQVDGSLIPSVWYKPIDLFTPSKIRIDPNDHIYVADETNRQIHRLTPDGDLQCLYQLDDIPEGGVAFAKIKDVTIRIDVHSDGRLFVLDVANRKIDIIGPDCQLVQGPALTNPWPIVPDRTIYGLPENEVADLQWFAEIAVDSEADLLYIVSLGSKDVDDDNTNPDTGGCRRENGSFNDIYGDDVRLDRVLTFDFEGNYQDEWYGIGYVPNGLLCYESPLMLAVDAQQNVFVADSSSSSIYQFDSNYQYDGEPPDGGVHEGYINSWLQRGYDIGQTLRNYDVNTDWWSSDVLLADFDAPRITRLDLITDSRPLATIVGFSADAMNLDPQSRLQVYVRAADPDASPGPLEYELTLEARDATKHVYSIEDPDYATVFDIAAADLAPGPYNPSLRVRDSEGNWSEAASFVGPNTPIFVNEIEQPTWTAMLYLAGDYDDGLLYTTYQEKLAMIMKDLPSADVSIIALLDGPARADTQLITITHSAAVRGVFLSTEEWAMDEGDTLEKFVRYAQANLPADHYYLAIADHGQGILGTAWDKTSDVPDNYLTVAEIDAALSANEIRAVDILHLDSCSMALFDVAYELRGQVSYLISSQYLGWSYFAYPEYVGLMSEDSDPKSLALKIMEEYAAQAGSDGKPYTISVSDLGKSGLVQQGIHMLSITLKSWIENVSEQDRITYLRSLRSQAQTFDSDGDGRNTEVDIYVDLYSWAQVLGGQAAGDLPPDVVDKSNILIQAISDFVIGTKSGNGEISPPTDDTDPIWIDLSGTHGISIYYPVFGNFPDIPDTSRSAETPIYTTSYAEYIHDELFLFTQVTQWNEFLQALEGAPMEGDPLLPAPDPLSILHTYKVNLPLIMGQSQP